jgi:hypothetical protein
MTKDNHQMKELKVRTLYFVLLDYKDTTCSTFKSTNNHTNKKSQNEKNDRLYDHN